MYETGSQWDDDCYIGLIYGKESTSCARSNVL